MQKQGWNPAGWSQSTSFNAQAIAQTKLFKPNVSSWFLYQATQQQATEVLILISAGQHSLIIMVS